MFIFREKGRLGEKHQCVDASPAPPTGDLAHNPGMCPDWELNPEPFGSQAHAQSAELHQPGWNLISNEHLSTCIKQNIDHLKLSILYFITDIYFQIILLSMD